MKLVGKIEGEATGMCAKCKAWFVPGQEVVAWGVSHPDVLGWSFRRLEHKECPKR